MKIILEFNNLGKSPLRKSRLEKIIRSTIGESGLDFLAKKTIEISAAVLSAQEIRKINRIYRHKNQATDILSFAEYKNAQELKKEKNTSVFLGELILCYNDIDVYAKKKGIKTEEEIANVLSHGVLHNLGMRHGRKMFNIQKEVVKKIN